MERAVKRTISSRETDKYDNVKQNLIRCSNAIYFDSIPFNRISANAKSILGIKIASC